MGIPKLPIFNVGCWIKNINVLLTTKSMIWILISLIVLKKKERKKEESIYIKREIKNSKRLSKQIYPEALFLVVQKFLSSLFLKKIRGLPIPFGFRVLFIKSLVMKGVVSLPTL